MYCLSAGNPGGDHAMASGLANEAALPFQFSV